jgi:uncharacterized membrane protein
VTRHRLGVGALVVLAAVLDGLCAFSRFRTLRSGTYDLVIFDQAVRSYSRFHPPIAIVKGVHNGFGPHFAVLGDHFSPILALLAPLYWIHDGPGTLLVAQSVLLALAVVPLWVLVRQVLGCFAAFAVAGAYVVAWPIAQAAVFDFHEVAFAPVLTAWLFERLTARRFVLWQVLALAVALLCVKEDMGLLLAGLGVALLVRGRRPLAGGSRPLAGGLRLSAGGSRSLVGGTQLLVGGSQLPVDGPRSLVDGSGSRSPAGGPWLLVRGRRLLVGVRRLLVGGPRLLGLGFVVGGLGATLLATDVLIPAFGGRADYYWSYGRLGADPPGVAWHLVRRPLDSLHVLLTPDVKWHTLLWLLAFGALAPLVSPYVLAVVPLLAERMLADSPNWWGTDYHYNAFLAVPLLVAGVDGAARIASWLGRGPSAVEVPHAEPIGAEAGVGGAHAERMTSVARWIGPGWAVVALVVGVVSVPSFALGGLVDRVTWEQSADDRAAVRAAAVVPDGGLVEAVNPVGPRLSGRTTVLLWDRTERDAPWVVADVARPRFPFCRLADQQDRVAHLEQEGYRVVFAERGYLVLHRAVTSPRLVAPPAPPCAPAG